jgi:hypothetical protein
MSNQLLVVRAMKLVGVIHVVPSLMKSHQIVQLLSSVQVQLNDQQLDDNTIL